MNVVALIGNLATDVDVREVTGGHKRASFVLAVDRRSVPDEADFFDVTAWDTQAASCEEYLAKGSKVAVDGRLRSRRWQTPDGTWRRAVEVVASRVEFLRTRATTPSAADDADGEPVADVVHLPERSMA